MSCKSLVAPNGFLSVLVASSSTFLLNAVAALSKKNAARVLHELTAFAVNEQSSNSSRKTDALLRNWVNLPILLVSRQNVSSLDMSQTSEPDSALLRWEVQPLSRPATPSMQKLSSPIVYHTAPLQFFERLLLLFLQPLRCWLSLSFLDLLQRLLVQQASPALTPSVLLVPLALRKRPLSRCCRSSPYSGRSARSWRLPMKHLAIGVTLRTM